jgi:hypothetical protein
MARVLAAVLAAVVLSLAGCASITKNIEETAKWQAKADEAARAAGVGEVTVILAQRAGYGGMYHPETRTLEVGPRDDLRDTERIFAHELSHHLFGHRGTILGQEIAANENAVLLLVRWGWTEETAVLWSERSLLSAKARGGLVPGHDYCVEYRDLERLYPQYRQTKFDVAKLCGGRLPSATSVLERQQGRAQ